MTREDRRHWTLDRGKLAWETTIRLPPPLKFQPGTAQRELEKKGTLENEEKGKQVLAMHCESCLLLSCSSEKLILVQVRFSNAARAAAFAVLPVGKYC